MKITKSFKIKKVIQEDTQELLDCYNKGCLRLSQNQLLHSKTLLINLNNIMALGNYSTRVNILCHAYIKSQVEGNRIIIGLIIWYNEGSFFLDVDFPMSFTTQER